MNHNERQALNCILDPANRTIEDVAEAAGLSPRTVWRYLRKPEFKAALREKQDAIINQTAINLAGLAGAAVDAFRDVLENPNEPGASNKRLTAKDILKLLDIYADREIIERIEALEEAILYRE